MTGNVGGGAPSINALVGAIEGFIVGRSLGGDESRTRIEWFGGRSAHADIWIFGEW